MIIICIKIPDKKKFNFNYKFEIGNKYNAYHLPGLGYEQSKGYWIDDKGISWEVNKEDFITYFITLEEWREKQIDKILKKD